MNVASLILTAAGLSFIGLGVQAPTPEWGAILNVETVQQRLNLI